MPMPTWSSIIASSSADTIALFAFFKPLIDFIFPALIVLAVIGIVMYLLHKFSK